MPPRTRYTPERILDAAAQLTRTDGLGAVSARSLAQALGCSTGPITSHFASMDALHEQLMDRIIARFVDAAVALDRPGDADQTDAAGAAGAGALPDPMVAVGLGWLRFAAEEPRLYEAVFLTRHPWHAKWGPVRLRLAERLAEHPRYAALGRRARFALVGRASIVMHGLGVEIWAGRLPAPDDDARRALLAAVAAPIVDAALAAPDLLDLHSFAPAPG